MKRVNQRVIGEIGEYAAQKYLLAAGFKLAQYGKAMSQSSNGKHLQTCLPVVSDHGLDCPIGNISRKLKQAKVKDLLAENLTHAPYGKGFIVTNLLVTEYIKRFYWKYLKENPLPP